MTMDDGGAGEHGALDSRRSLAASRAFRAASLRSEVTRAYGVLGVLGLVLILVLSREFNADLDERIPLTGLIGVGTLIALQGVVLTVVHWARKRGRLIPGWFTVATVVFESAIPTWIILLQIGTRTIPPYAVLAAPPVVAYGLLIGLETLRLRPWLCVLSGAISAGGYLGAYLYVRYGLQIERPATGLPKAAYASFAGLIFISGIAAAWVAREIRGHFYAALGEAETRRQMDRIERDISAARSIQRALLPRAAPRIAGFDIAGWNRPADQTGGDYYDWQQLPDGTWLVSLADVSGHGIGPALVTAACRAYARASSRFDGELSSLTTRINRLLADDLPEGRFVTFVGVLIDPRTAGDAVRMLSAGHGPLLLRVSATGEVKEIMPSDVPLAVMPDTAFSPAQDVPLAPGDVLVLITDGFFEWSRPTRVSVNTTTGDQRPREQFGMARLRASLARHAGKAAAEMVEALAADVTAFAAGEPQQDDLTVVVIKRTQ